MKHSLKRKSKVTVLFFLITIAFLAFMLRIFYIALSSSYSLPTLYTLDVNRAVRGDIVSKDGFIISTSKKKYFAEIDTRNLNPAKKKLFVKLFSIYSDMEEEEIAKTINSHFGYVRLTYNIDDKKAKHLKVLARELIKRDVFIEYVDVKKGLRFLHGLEILENEEYREFLFNDVLTPIIGYMNKKEVNSIITPFAVKGLEYFYRDFLVAIRDSKISGKRDVGSNIIYNKETKIQNRLDGCNVNLTIDLKLQKAIESILDKSQKDLNSTEIIAAIMDSDTGEILSLATTRRFDPNKITNNLAPLNISAIEYNFEPGSVIKPITYALLLREKKIEEDDIFSTLNGHYEIGSQTITDSHKMPKYLTAQNAVVYSSNVVFAQMVQKLTALEYYNGLRDFGFFNPSKIDLAYEKIGKIPSLSQFNSKIYKATLSYGYSIEVNFIQLLRAYASFNNGGYLITPHLASHTTSPLNEIKKFNNSEKVKILDQKSAQATKDVLIKTVQQGTGQNAITYGFEVGGKTGTAHVATNDGYKDIYNSSFFGFVNDKNKKYTIGVTVINLPKEKYYASQTATPLFKYIIDMMIYNNYLK